jgi:hypothetical protein
MRNVQPEDHEAARQWTSRAFSQVVRNAPRASLVPARKLHAGTAEISAPRWSHSMRIESECSGIIRRTRSGCGPRCPAIATRSWRRFSDDAGATRRVVTPFPCFGPFENLPCEVPDGYPKNWTRAVERDGSIWRTFQGTDGEKADPSVSSAIPCSHVSDLGRGTDTSAVVSNEKPTPLVRSVSSC